MEMHPALQGRMGTWRYYSTKMTARSLASTVRLASEVWEKKSLDHWIQRILKTSRSTGSIASYLAKHDDRFFNSIVVAALDGDPTFFPVDLADDPKFEMLSDKRFMDAFGVLRFDGSQKYYALDGQHRLHAIRALLDGETDFVPPKGFEDEEFSVLIVVPQPDESRKAFLKRYRRLFSHLNRYAKPMDKATTIVMEEDDAIAIATRGLIADHHFFSCMSDAGDPRIRALKPENLRVDEPYFTSIEALYKANTNLLYSKFRKNTDPDWGPKGLKPSKKLEEFIRFRPEEEFLESMYEELALYWDGILSVLPDLKKDPQLMRTNRSKDEDADDGRSVRTNNLLFRPIGLEMFTRVVRDLFDEIIEDPQNPNSTVIADALRGIDLIDWRLHQPPWRHLLFVYDSGSDKWGMRNEDRKKAVNCGEAVLRYITGLESHSEESLKVLRAGWRALLIGCDEEEANESWKSVDKIASTFLEARES